MCFVYIVLEKLLDILQEKERLVMKKSLIGVLLLVAATSYAANSDKSSKSKKEKLVSIDSIFLMQESQEGKLLAGKFQKEVLSRTRTAPKASKNN